VNFGLAIGIRCWALKDKPGETKTIGFDMLHIGPPQRAAAVVRESPIAHQDRQMVGFTKVDIHTLQSPDYPNVFGLGDAAGLPVSRTGAAVRKQVPVLINNMLKVMQGKEPDKRYDGYTSCPLVTAYGRMVLAELDYDDRPTPSIPLINTQKERFDMWLLKKYGLPFMYWNLMLRGLA
jgi:sulfide:quinone oxidoreductase